MSLLLFYIYLILLLILMTTSTITTTSSSKEEEQKEALLGLKAQIIDNSNNLVDWSSSSDSSVCSWSGITCNSSVITTLDLSDRNLSGSISSNYIKMLINLVHINLSHNSLSGSFPSKIFTHLPNLITLDISRNVFEGTFVSLLVVDHHPLVFLDAYSNSFSGRLPEQLTKLESLKVLNLAGNYFQGSIPSSYGFFKNLEFLHLAGNLLDSEIPPELGNLKTLTHMEIGYNSYQGSLPWEFGNMTNLRYLDIASANLSGSIPKHFCNFMQLQSLFLFMNKLTGPIPFCFGNITSLQNLDLSDNFVMGSIPKSFEELKNLRLLSLMYNEMSGSIPDEIATLPQLESLLVWNNFFSGSLPLNLGYNNSQLKWVDVSSNNLTGTIPPHICFGGMLSKLILFSNNFTGGLAPSLTNCSSIIRLRIESNSFSGDISVLKSSFNNAVQYADLSRNRFEGGIPTNLFSQAFELENFNISNNPKLDGFIPNEIWSLRSLVNFSASSCSISGTLPPPSSKFKCSSSILTIELSNNNLSGTIPESIVNCESLRVLSLSHNKLTGSIPIKFANSSSLVLLNISFNEVYGSIPQSNNFRVMGRTAFIGNPNLCGVPLEVCSDSKETNNTELGTFGLLGIRKNSKKLEWVLLLCASVILFLVMSVLGIFYIHNHRREKWKMISFTGLPQFTSKDILRSFSTSDDSIKTLQPLSVSSTTLVTVICKAILPTGVAVLVKKIEWETKQREVTSEFINSIGNARHKNLVRLLGVCSTKKLAYLLYDYYLPSENLAEKMKRTEPTRKMNIVHWKDKYKIVIGIARGLCYLHHECNPPIPHGDLKSSNIVFDEGNMEDPHLAEFGLKLMLQMNTGAGFLSSTDGNEESVQLVMKEEMHKDIFSFGEILFEILSNGRLINAEGSLQSKPNREKLLREICDQENAVVEQDIRLYDDMKLVFEVAMLCTRTNPSNRPSIHEALKLLQRHAQG